VNGSSATQTVAVVNNGNQPLIFSSITPGANTAWDSQATTCSIPGNASASLVPASACQIGVVFARRRRVLQ